MHGKPLASLLSQSFESHSCLPTWAGDGGQAPSLLLELHVSPNHGLSDLQHRHYEKAKTLTNRNHLFSTELNCHLYHVLKSCAYSGLFLTFLICIHIFQYISLKVIWQPFNHCNMPSLHITIYSHFLIFAHYIVYNLFSLFLIKSNM